MHIGSVQPTQILIARPNPVTRSLWSWYFNLYLNRSFARMMIAGEGAVASWRKGALRRSTEPLILYCTHYSWWDAVLAFEFSARYLQLDAIQLMELQQLQRHLFFRSNGVFDPLDRSRSTLDSLKKAAGEIRNSGRVLWTFPQGTITHPEHVVHCGPGLALLMREVGVAWLCPVGIRYESLQAPKPTVIVRFGKAERVEWTEHGEIGDVAEALTQRLAFVADRVRSDVMNRHFSAYTDVFQHTSQRIPQRK
jgi:1-acyl-sn-glycerol-3-phosphate acyltransferase